MSTTRDCICDSCLNDECGGSWSQCTPCWGCCRPSLESSFPCDNEQFYTIVCEGTIIRLPAMDNEKASDSNSFQNENSQNKGDNTKLIENPLFIAPLASFSIILLLSCLLILFCCHKKRRKNRAEIIIDANEEEEEEDQEDLEKDENTESDAVKVKDEDGDAQQIELEALVDIETKETS